MARWLTDETCEIAGKVHALWGVRVGGLSNDFQEGLHA